MTGVTAKAVKEFSGLPQTAKLRKYYNDGFFLCGKYRLEVVGTGTNEPQNKLSGADQEAAKAIKLFGPVAYSKWSRLNRRYGSK